MFGSYHIATVRGVPIRLHFTVFLLLILIGGNLLFALTISILVLFSVALHELGHTMVSQRYGIQVQDILLTPVGGVARLRGLPENPRHEIRIALAGPYVSLLLALTGFGLGYLTALGGMGLLTAVLIWFASINTALLLFNLLPSFPMDGGRVLRGWLSQKKGPLEATRIASQLGKYMAVAFIVLGLLGPASGSLAVIGLFIFLSAGSEYRMMQMKTWQDQSFGQAGNRFDPGFEASPPPYASKPRTAAPSGLWGDMRITAVDLFQEICSACKR